MSDYLCPKCGGWLSIILPHECCPQWLVCCPEWLDNPETGIDNEKNWQSVYAVDAQVAVEKFAEENDTDDYLINCCKPVLMIVKEKKDSGNGEIEKFHISAEAVIEYISYEVE